MVLPPMPRMKAGPNSYQDIQRILDNAWERGGARIDVGSQAAAIRMVQRMNQFRIIDRKVMYESVKRRVPDPNNFDAVQDYEKNINQMWALASVYDHLIIRRPVDGMVIIEKKPSRPYVAMYDLEGNLIDEGADVPIQAPKPADSQPNKEKFDPGKPLNLLDGDEE
jgi:hypothetical protein